MERRDDMRLLMFCEFERAWAAERIDLFAEATERFFSLREAKNCLLREPSPLKPDLFRARFSLLALLYSSGSIKSSSFSKFLR